MMQILALFSDYQIIESFQLTYISDQSRRAVWSSQMYKYDK